MGEIQYQNPAAGNATAQLESKLKGVASDGVTELRREVVSASDVVGKLDEVVQAIKNLEQTIISVFR